MLTDSLMLHAPAAAQEAAPKSGQAPMSWAAFTRALWPEAKDFGVSKATFDGIFATLQPDCKQPGVYCSGGSSPKGAGDGFASLRAKGLPETCFKVTQKEFLHPANYFPANYMSKLALQAQGLIRSWREQRPDIYKHVLQIERDYEIDHKLLIALWGRETSFGGASLGHNAVRSLASMAYATAPARRGWARKQLLAALKMVDRGAISFENFRSSYAGATGLTQIMPDEFLERGADGDGDGRIDIWNSIPDALATTANVLKAAGWSGEQRTWGYEVRSPRGAPRLDCTLEGPLTKKSIGDWASAHELTPALGNGSFPAPANPGYLVLPAGMRGPLFIATDNFEVLRRYNTSDVYALFIGNLTDRIACEKPGKPCPFEGAWPGKGADDDFEFSVENLCRLQIELKNKGFSNVVPDGLFGKGTRIGIGNYQKSLGQSPDCYPTKALFRNLTGG